MSSRVRWSTAATLLFAALCVLLPANTHAQDATDGSRKVIARVTPQYPSIARTMNIKGSVKVEAVVAPNGTAKSVDIKGGHPVLAQSAVNAVRQWKWEPGQKETRELIEIKFSQ